MQLIPEFISRYNSERQISGLTNRIEHISLKTYNTYFLACLGSLRIEVTRLSRHVERTSMAKTVLCFSRTANGCYPMRWRMAARQKTRGVAKSVIGLTPPSFKRRSPQAGRSGQLQRHWEAKYCTACTYYLVISKLAMYIE